MSLQEHQRFFYQLVTNSLGLDGVSDWNSNEHPSLKSFFTNSKERQDLYRKLIHQNMAYTIEQACPLSWSKLSDDQKEKWVTNFLNTGARKSPHFRELALEFDVWLQNNLEQNFSTLAQAELWDYEVTRFKLMFFNFGNDQPDLISLDGPAEKTMITLNPNVSFKSYKHAVHLVENESPELKTKTSFLLLYRHATTKFVKIIELESKRFELLRNLFNQQSVLLLDIVSCAQNAELTEQESLDLLRMLFDHGLVIKTSHSF